MRLRGRLEFDCNLDKLRQLEAEFHKEGVGVVLNWAHEGAVAIDDVFIEAIRVRDGRSKDAARRFACFR